MANSVGPDQTAPIEVHAVCFYTYFVSIVRQLFAADDVSRRHIQTFGCYTTYAWAALIGLLKINSSMS